MGKEHPPKIVPLWLKFLYGSVSGVISTILVQPADLVKTRMQLQGAAVKKLSGFQIARGVVQRKGFRGLYAGLSAAVFRQFLFSGVRLGCFNGMFDWYAGQYGTPSLGIKMLMGSAAGVLGSIVSMPPEVALIRMTSDGRLPLDKRKNYKNVFDCIIRMVREEGIGILARGLYPTLTRAVLINGAQLAAYTQAREALLPSLGDGVLLHFCASLISGLVTTFVNQPVDMIKTRIQNSPVKVTQFAVMMKIIRKQGVLGLWSGFVPAYVKIGPHTIITFLVLEQMNAYYLKYYA